MSGLRAGLSSLPVLLLLTGCGRAPVLREMTYSRPYSGEERLAARVEFTAGRLAVGRADSDRLFAMDLRYDAGRFRPVGAVEPDGTVRLGTEAIRGRGGRGFRIGRSRLLPQTARIGFSARPELDLELGLGAAEAAVELGGLRLASLEVTTGASATEIGFAEPNPGSCRQASVTSGAGTVQVERAANSGCAEWRFDGGVGKITIDLGGTWRADARMVFNQAVGGITLRAPSELGIRVTLRGFLARFEGAGFARTQKTYTSAGYEDATRKLEVEVNAAVGGVRVERTGE